VSQCKVCNHPDREEFERKIASKELSMSKIAVEIGCNKSSISRHMRHCFPKKVATWVTPEATKEETLNVVNELVRSHKNLLELYEEARAIGNIDAAIRALGEERRHLELVAKLTGQLNESPQINLLMNPEFMKLKQIIVKQLAPFPEARLALSDALDTIAEDDTK